MTTNGNSGTGLQKYDWDPVRLAYVQGRENGSGHEWPTLEQLAQEHGIAASTVRSRATREQWVQQRGEFATLCNEKALDTAVESLAGKLSQCSIGAFSAGRAAIALASQRYIAEMQKEKPDAVLARHYLSMVETGYRLTRRALGVGDTSE